MDNISKINMWINRLNVGKNKDIYNSYSYEEYKHLFQLCIAENLEKTIKKILLPEGISPGVSIALGNKDKCDFLCYGENGNGKQLNHHTLFDLASITKFFLGIVYMYLIEQGKLRLEASICEYSDRFKKIAHLRIKDLLSYNVYLETSVRLDEMENAYMAESILNDIGGAYSKTQVYSDMPPIVLAEILEDATGIGFGEWIGKIFAERLGLVDFCWGNFDCKEKKCVNYKGEKWLTNKGICERENPIGVVNDLKARLLGVENRKLLGNAGIFCSTQDMAKVCQALLAEKIISRKSIILMAEGNGWNSKGNRQSFGYLCYRKYVDKRQSEVPAFLSAYAISASGYTGCYVVIDILNGIFSFIGGNRLFNCISKNMTDLEEREGCFIVNGVRYKSGVSFVYQRDELRDIVCGYALVKYT